MIKDSPAPDPMAPAKRRPGRPKKKDPLGEAVPFPHVPIGPHVGDVATNHISLGEDEARLATQAEILERRLHDPEGQAAPKIVLKNPTQMPRWFNTRSEQGQRIWTAKAKGYIYVRPEDVADLDTLGLYAVNADGAITRGALSEQEVLMSIDRAMFDAIHARREAIQMARFHSQTAMKSDLANAAGAKFGDEAGAGVERMVGQILTTKDQEHR